MPDYTDSICRRAATDELYRIADWWLNNSFDRQFGGFVGEIDHQGQVIAGAGKGIVLISRILWFFSELCLFDQGSRYRLAADRAFN